MAYKIGISTGWWSIGKQPELLGMHLKAAYAATAGVTFAQIDLETTAEFFTPEVREDVRRIQEDLGIEIGLHGEIGAAAALESAIRRTWDQSHLRLVETVRHAADLKFTYVNLHWSSTAQLVFEEDRYWIQGYFYPVVSFDGEPFAELCEKNKAVKEEALKLHIEARPGQSVDEEQWYEAIKRGRERAEREAEAKRGEISKRYDVAREQLGAALKEGKINKEQYDDKMREIKDAVDHEVEQERQRLVSSVERGNVPDDLVFDAWKKSNFGKYVLKGGEISAYILVAFYMMETKDPLWEKIVGPGVKPWDAYFNKHAQFNAAVAAKYIEGHLNRAGKGDMGKYNAQHLGGKTVRQWLEDKKLYLLFEVPEVSVQHAEGQYRLFDPADAYWLIKAMGCKYLKQCIDFEHLLSQKRNPDEVIDRMPEDGGSTVLLFHLGTPLPYGGTAHIPIPRGSRAQEQIYKWIWKLKQKGFGSGFDGYMVYERGGGQTTLEVVRDSVQSLRLIKKYLELNTHFNDLPEEFYGLSTQNEGEYRRQLVNIRDKAFEPIKGLLTIPEETYTFLGSQAVQKGKTEEWLKGRYR